MCPSRHTILSIPFRLRAERFIIILFSLAVQDNVYHSENIRVGQYLYIYRCLSVLTQIYLAPLFLAACIEFYYKNISCQIILIGFTRNNITAVKVFAVLTSPTVFTQ